jgi:hypothetical protein
VSRTWFRIALALDGDRPTLVAAAGGSLGEALAAARKSAPTAWPVAAARIAEDAIPLGESVGRSGVVELGAAPEGTPTFRWPAGVLPALGPGAAVGRIGHTARRADGLSVIEAQTDHGHLHELFLAMVERIPSADNLEVRVLEHFDGGAPATTDVWLTSRIDGNKIIRFLDDHEDELIGNGHVELAVYAREARGTLRLTEHKTVAWVAEDPAHDEVIARSFARLGLPEIEVLPTVAGGPHFHFRGAKSRSRKALGDHLYRQRLRRVDVIKGRS